MLRKSAGMATERRKLLKGGAVLGAATAGAIAMPHVRRAEAAETTTWKVQTSWPAGVGLATFKTGRHHQGKDRRRTRVQAVRRQGSRRRFRVARWRQERRARSDELVHRLLGRQNAGDGVPVVLPDGPALSARVGRVLLQQGRPEDGARSVRQAGPDVCRPHPPRTEHHPLQEADPLDRGLQGPQAARTGRHDRRRFRGDRRQDDVASGRRSVLGAGEGHHRGGRLYGSGGELGPRLPAGDQIHLDGTARTGIDLSAGRLDGLLRRHGPLEQALAQDEAVGRERGRGLLGAPPRRNPEGRHGSLAEIREGGHPDQSPVRHRTSRNSSASRCRSGSNGRTRTRTRPASSRLSSTSWNRRRSATSRPTCIRVKSSTSRTATAAHPRRRPFEAERRGAHSRRVRSRSLRRGFRGNRCPVFRFVLPHWLYWGT